MFVISTRASDSAGTIHGVQSTRIRSTGRGFRCIHDGSGYATGNIQQSMAARVHLRGTATKFADAVDTSFKKASLRGARFFKSDCERADFTGADLTGASFESANLKDAILSNAKAEGTAFSQTILDAKSFEGADFTEAVVQPYVQKELCKRATGATAESLFCP